MRERREKIQSPLEETYRLKDTRTSLEDGTRRMPGMHQVAARLTAEY
jgi:hypothetical protein